MCSVAHLGKLANEAWIEGIGMARRVTAGWGAWAQRWRYQKAVRGTIPILWVSEPVLIESIVNESPWYALHKLCGKDNVRLQGAHLCFNCIEMKHANSHVISIHHNLPSAPTQFQADMLDGIAGGRISICAYMCLKQYIWHNSILTWLLGRVFQQEIIKSLTIESSMSVLGGVEGCCTRKHRQKGKWRPRP